MPKKDKRFEILEKQSTLGTETYIIRDRETGAQYLYHSNGFGAGLAPLLGRDGQPVITSSFSEP